MSLQARAIAVLALLLLVAAGWWKLTAHYEAKGYARAQAEAREQLEAFRQRTIDLQRAAEKRYIVEAQERERVITETIIEVRHAAAPLAACPLPAGVAGMLNTAAAAARGDPAAASGAGEPVLEPR